MNTNVNNAYGLLATLTKNGNNTQIDFAFKNLSGVTLTSQDGTGSIVISGSGSGSSEGYELANGPVSQETYVIVAKVGSNHYALTTERITSSNINYLKGEKVTVIGNSVLASDVDSSMLWKFIADGNGFNVMNGSSYLNRLTQGSAGLEINTTEGAASYSDWIYDSGEKTFETYSSTVSKSFYAFFNESSSYFGNSETDKGEIYLYKLTEEIVVPPTMFTVSFNSNGGSSVSPITVALGQTITLPTPSRSGFNFEGWFREAGLVNQFTNQDLVNEDLTLFAKWSEVVTPPGNSGGPVIVVPQPQPDPEPEEDNKDEEVIEVLPETPTAPPFVGYEDTPEDAWYFEAVKFVSLRELMVGTGSNKFQPDGPLTRGMFVTILSRLEFGGSENIPKGKSKFIDLNQEWYKDSIAWASEHDIVLGVSEDRFDPDALITREQMAAVLHRYAKHKGLEANSGLELLAKFSDSGIISEYAQSPMAWAVESGLIKGMSETIVSPKSHTTRAQAATIFERLFGFIEEIEN